MFDQVSSMGRSGSKAPLPIAAGLFSALVDIQISQGISMERARAATFRPSARPVSLSK
jgi:hypothetical protein